MKTKKIKFGIALNPKGLEEIEKCAKVLEVSRSEMIEKMLYAELERIRVSYLGAKAGLDGS